jgi:hypothetical protein
MQPPKIKTCVVYLCHDFSLHSGNETATYTWFALCLLLDQTPYGLVPEILNTGAEIFTVPWKWRQQVSVEPWDLSLNTVT